MVALAVVVFAVIQLFGGSDGPGRSGSSGAARITASTADRAGTTGTTLSLPSTRSSDLPAISTGDLPEEALAVLALIEAGGPFPYDQDGATFQNREGLLPRRSGGYYREYTVETPGSPDRGPRRIIAGDGGERYYTDDHYASFREIKR